MTTETDWLAQYDLTGAVRRSMQGPDMPQQPRVESGLQLYGLDAIQVTIIMVCKSPGCL